MIFPGPSSDTQLEVLKNIFERITALEKLAGIEPDLSKMEELYKDANESN